MSATGKNTLAIRKKDLAGQVNPSVAVKKLVFAHKFVGGETGFNLLSLTTPTTEMVGFTNPSAAEIAQVSILINRNNLTLVSTAKNIMMDYISFSPGSSTQINFASGVTALAGEVIVGTVQALISGGAVIADANPISISGTLLAGQTDIIVPPFEALKNVTVSNIGAVMVVMDGNVKFRNPGNATAGAEQDTNNSHYEEVNAGNSMSTVIRMNTSESFDRKYTVMSIGHSVFKPTESAMATVDVLAGQMDKVISVLADVSGQATSYFQSNPNSVDLRAFGELVYSFIAFKSLSVSTALTAKAYQRILTDSSGGAFTITLPAAPAIGDQIEVFDATDSWVPNNVTLGRNGLNIQGLASDLVLNVDGGKARLIYFNTAQGWRVYQ